MLQDPIKVEQTTMFNLYLGIGLAVLALIQTLALAGITGWITSRKEKRDAQRKIEAAEAEALIKSKEKQEDWRRQDAVAERAEHAAALLLAAQRETIERTDKVAQLTEAATKQTATKLDQIHVLVNSEMTAARKSERDTQQLLVMALKNSLALGKSLGHLQDPHELDGLAVAEQRIIKLNKIIADREEAQAKLDEELRRQGIALARRAEDQLANNKTLQKIEANTAATVDALRETVHPTESK